MWFLVIKICFCDFFFQGKVKAEMGFSSLLVLVLLVFFHHFFLKKVFFHYLSLVSWLSICIVWQARFHMKVKLSSMYCIVWQARFHMHWWHGFGNIMCADVIQFQPIRDHRRVSGNEALTFVRIHNFRLWGSLIYSGYAMAHCFLLVMNL